MWGSRLPQSPPHPGFSIIEMHCPSLLHCRVNATAKPCTTSILRMCRTSAPAARRHGRSPCRCPCTAPTAPLSTMRSSTPCSADAPPGSAASEATAVTAVGACCRLPRPQRPECCPVLLYALLLCPSRPTIKANLPSCKRLMVHCFFWTEMTTVDGALVLRLVLREKTQPLFENTLAPGSVGGTAMAPLGESGGSASTRCGGEGIIRGRPPRKLSPVA